MKRVVITGMGGVSPLGDNWEDVFKNLKAKENKVVQMPEWDKYKGLNTRLAVPVPYFETPEHYTRKQIRSMGRVSLLATRATELALIDANLIDNKEIKDGSMGIAYGSSSGSPDAIGNFMMMRINGEVKGVTANTYVQLMSHTAAANVGIFFNLKGRIIPTCSACTSGSQGIGYAYESVKFGRQVMMVAGGAEELCATEAAVFDTLYAASIKNDTPKLTPRPYDRDRDGLVVGEGAGTMVLEELSHAQARGAHIYAEIIGYGTNSDGYHSTQPIAETMQGAMKLSLADAKLKPDAIGYINAHATSTSVGDVAESRATNALFGNKIPISSLKSYMGHTLGACGALEAWMTIQMMNNDWYSPTINLDNVDEECAELDYIMGDGREMQNEYVMTNNFAFGGINTSLIFKRWR
ncbi:MAG: beta-ketoacyl-ACP synthase [Spirochaetia bacterium]|nr:beta-ketoacyl-ACP synthase [Spirochaetia bacterium]